MPKHRADYWFFDPVRALVTYQAAGYDFDASEGGQLVQGPTIRFSESILRELAEESRELKACIDRIFALADASRETWKRLLREMVAHYAKQDCKVTIEGDDLVVTKEKGSMVPQFQAPWGDDEEIPF